MLDRDLTKDLNEEALRILKMIEQLPEDQRNGLLKYMNNQNEKSQATSEYIKIDTPILNKEIRTNARDYSINYARRMYNYYIESLKYIYANAYRSSEFNFPNEPYNHKVLKRAENFFSILGKLPGGVYEKEEFCSVVFAPKDDIVSSINKKFLPVFEFVCSTPKGVSKMGIKGEEGIIYKFNLSTLYIDGKVQLDSMSEKQYKSRKVPVVMSIEDFLEKVAKEEVYILN